MTDDLVKRLREGDCLHNQLEAHELTKEAANRIEELQKHFEHAISIFSMMRTELYVVSEIMKAFPDE